MLRAVPKHWFSWDFTVMDGSKPLALIDTSIWREKGVLTVDGVDYRVYREGLLRGDFVLESSGSVLARAAKPSAFRRSFTLTHRERTYTLRARSTFRRAFVLLDGSTVIGSIAPEGVFTRKARVDLPDDLPLPVRIFAVWLTVILWKREAESAAAGGGGS